MKKRSGDSSRLGDVGEMLMQKPPLGTPLDWGNPLNDETVLALAMNEGHGDKVQDLSMNGNHGTLNNFAFPPTVASGWNPGEAGVGLNFDGTDDYITLTRPITLDRNGSTFSTLFRTSASPAGQYADTAQLIGNNNKFQAYIGYDTNEIRAESNTNGDYWSIASVDILSFEWHNIILSAENGIVSTYIDGNYKNSQSPANDLTLSVLGGVYTANDVWHTGSINGTRIQSRAWTAKEVKDYAINPWQVYEQ